MPAGFSSGNAIIPAGKVLWDAILHKNGTYGRGRALLANSPGEFHADAADKFRFHWTNDKFVVHYHRYDPEIHNPVTDDNGATITNTYLLEGRPRPE